MHLRVFDLGFPLIVSPKRSHLSFELYIGMLRVNKGVVACLRGWEKKKCGSILINDLATLGFSFKINLPLSKSTPKRHTKRSLFLSETHAHMEALSVWTESFVRFRKAEYHKMLQADHATSTNMKQITLDISHPDRAAMDEGQLSASIRPAEREDSSSSGTKYCIMLLCHYGARRNI